MVIEYCNGYDDASAKAYLLLLKQLKSNKKTVLGLPTGSTPLGIYQCMMQGFSSGDFSYRDIISFNLDEYAGLSPEDPHSYYQFMMENLFNGIDINEDNINIPFGLGDLEENCINYDMRIESAGGIDVQILAVGRNGHIGFNEPGIPFGLTTHIAELSDETRADNARFFDSFEDVPRQAVTMGIRSIMNARQIIFIGSGAEKAEALRQTLFGPVTVECPSSVLQLHPNITFFIDRDAGRIIKEYTS